MNDDDEIVAGLRMVAGGPRMTAADLAAAPRNLSGRSLARRPGGLLLRAGQDNDGCIVVLDQDDAALLSLGPFGHDAVIAIWRHLAAASGLPLVIAGPDGGFERPIPQIGRLQLGRVRVRRRLAVLNGRRPRFLVRRKFARLPVRPLVYREREIATGRGC